MCLSGMRAFSVEDLASVDGSYASTALDVTVTSCVRGCVRSTFTLGSRAPAAFCEHKLFRCPART